MPAIIRWAIGFVRDNIVATLLLLVGSGVAGAFGIHLTADDPPMPTIVRVALVTAITSVGALIGLVWHYFTHKDPATLATSDAATQEVQIDGVLWRRAGDTVAGPFCTRDKTSLEFEGRPPKDSDTVFSQAGALVTAESQCPRCTERYALGSTTVIPCVVSRRTTLNHSLTAPAALAYLGCGVISSDCQRS